MTPTSNLQDESLYDLCSGDVDTQCSCKIAEIVISFLLLCWAIIEGTYHIPNIRTAIQCLVTIILIVITLLINILYNIWGEIYALFILETLFYNFYFLSLVICILKRYLKKTSDTYYRYRKLVIAVTCIHIMIFTAIFLDQLISINNQGSKCQTVWNLFINAECIVLCLATCMVLFINHYQQSRKIATYLQSSFYFDKKKINNPLKWVWTWIGLNIFSQVINMIQNGLFLKALPENGCQILPSQQTNSILRISFTIVDLHLGFVATLLYYAWVRYRFKVYLADNQKFQLSEQYQCQGPTSSDNNFQILLTNNSQSQNL